MHGQELVSLDVILGNGDTTSVRSDDEVVCRTARRGKSVLPIDVRLLSCPPLVPPVNRKLARLRILPNALCSTMMCDFPVVVSGRISSSLVPARQTAISCCFVPLNWPTTAAVALDGAERVKLYKCMTLYRRNYLPATGALLSALLCCCSWLQDVNLMDARTSIWQEDRRRSRGLNTAAKSRMTCIHSAQREETVK
jgi:hypothetical protein